MWMGPRRAPIQLSCESVPVIAQMGILVSDADLGAWKGIKTEDRRLGLLTHNTKLPCGPNGSLDVVSAPDPPCS